MDDPQDAATQEPADLEEKGAAQEAATPTSQPPAGDAGDVLKRLEERLNALEARTPTVDPAQIAAQLRQLPAFKQSLKALTQNAVRAEIEAEIERRTQTIDLLEEKGLLEPDAAEKERRAVAKQVRAEFSKRPPPIEVEEEQQQQQQPPTDVRQIAAAWLQKYGLTWDDVPEFKMGAALPPDQQAFLDIVIDRAVSKRADSALAARVQEELKKRAEAAQRVRGAEKDALKPPPDGNVSGPPQKKRTLADADEIGNILNREVFKIT